MLDKKEDPDGLFFEKAFLLQEVVRIVEQLFFQFVKIRISPEWMTEHLPAIRNWIQTGGAPGRESQEGELLGGESEESPPF